MGKWRFTPLVNIQIYVYIRIWKITMFNGNNLLSMAIFHSYINLPEGMLQGHSDYMGHPAINHAHSCKSDTKFNNPTAMSARVRRHAVLCPDLVIVDISAIKQLILVLYKPNSSIFLHQCTYTKACKHNYHNNTLYIYIYINTYITYLTSPMTNI